ncbi:RagB/SusD family nutrient uptake outer membrane protein [Lepagella muris]|jgi:hypothetical protein|uniref:RagB/SusD family nutrient uptake outer membrane protein n=1 Tax=Lepagella muris TaxID=3032870 RepID=A0AC61RI60_9BACT|nr:RagB/SusD family nutrient uptake outer membrane protein [Lepagella muris]ROT07065.1 RagB/SusD family nutrient uptake outer membrane protein [Muribaculaceae bacterium Isolate-037 (Harlan)]TGY77974.1 RagB/SusD family nutrient uptake outer membrane protein [Lepagella muris]THG51430.1 RagB/SusD family nutrient uptake outer membrane protein [Bacteroidales bacterium]TKC56401.1 RagB/SusD family nutrient uptake outer membrane protein [Bacteroidales bacterium]
MNNFKINIFSLGIAALATAAMTTGCSNSFLDVESKVDSNTQNFYKSEADAWRALIGCYNGWRQTSSYGGISFYIASTIMSDETYSGTGNSDGKNYMVIDRFDTGMSPADQQIYSTDWAIYYKGVYRCNELITRADGINWNENSSKRGLYIGEARALRALLYFDMVRLWGNIPLFLEPVNENREQADPAEVYANIFEDLKYAIANIPDDANLGVDNFGRVSKYAAEAVAARAYLFYTGYYGKEPGFTDAEGKTIGTFSKSDALAAVEDVISSGQYELLENYKDFWPASSLVANTDAPGWNNTLSTYAGDANKEAVLSMNFTPMASYATDASADGNRWQVMIGMRSPLSVLPYYCGWGACTVNTPFMNNIYEANDQRLKAGVIDIVGEGVNSSSNFSPSYSDWREYTGYSIKKYSPIAFLQYQGDELVIKNANMSTGAGDMQINNCQPYNIVRYSDVLLMAAELGSPNADNYMHMVRSRAGLPDIAVNQENIMKERARELAFEGIRYWDLLRQGVEVMADAVVATAGPVHNGGTPANVEYNRAKIVATKGLSQIPNDQIVLSNGVLKQNEGWK